MDKNVDTLLQKLYDLIKDNRVRNRSDGATDIVECKHQFNNLLWRSELELNIKPQYERYIQYLKNKNGAKENIDELKDIAHEMISAIAKVPDYSEILKDLGETICTQVNIELNKYWEDRKIK